MPVKICICLEYTGSWLEGIPGILPVKICICLEYMGSWLEAPRNLLIFLAQLARATGVSTPYNLPPPVSGYIPVIVQKAQKGFRFYPLLNRIGSKGNETGKTGSAPKPGKFYLCACGPGNPVGPAPVPAVSGTFAGPR